MDFETEAYIDEYVIDGENTGEFVGDDTCITYTPADQDMWSSFAIPTDEVTSVTFKRNTSLLRNRFLGWFFAVITVLLIVVAYVAFFADQLTDPDLNGVTVFMFFLILGGITTTYDYFTGESHDVIAIFLRTADDEIHTVHGRMKDTGFVDACGELIESDLETINQNEKLEGVLSR